MSGSEKGSGDQMNCNVFNLAMENVLKGKFRDPLFRHHTQMHFKSNEMYTFLITFKLRGRGDDR